MASASYERMSTYLSKQQRIDVKSTRWISQDQQEAKVRIDVESTHQISQDQQEAKVRIDVESTRWISQDQQEAKVRIDVESTHQILLDPLRKISKKRKWYHRTVQGPRVALRVVVAPNGWP